MYNLRSAFKATSMFANENFKEQLLQDWKYSKTLKSLALKSKYITYYSQKRMQNLRIKKKQVETKSHGSMHLKSLRTQTWSRLD